MSQRLKIEGGTVYDPANGIRGSELDIWIQDGTVIAPPVDSAATSVIDARGRIVMPGGIDMHCHIAGAKVNAARMMFPDWMQRCSPKPGPQLPPADTPVVLASCPTTGYLYAALGYTTAFDAAIAPLFARQAHWELRDTPCLDAGIFVKLGNHRYVLESLHEKQPQRLKPFLAWLINATRAYAPKIVNPGGVESWKCGDRGPQDLDQQVRGFDVTPRQIISELAIAANELALPHPVHLHCNNLGRPGNWETTLKTMNCLDSLRAHLTHIQFHSYGGEGDDPATMTSQVAQLAAYVNTHPEISVDVGQVMFGPTVSMTADSPLSHYLSRVYRSRWTSIDVEMETGCGIAPIHYRDKNFVHALQWAIGLEWYLMVDDPWQIAMTTDHPNGGSFMAYPQIIQLLMDSGYRREMLMRLPERARQRTMLGELSREYTLEEIAIITRAAPARMLGLQHKGHLGPGADGDVVIYTDQSDRQQMFQLPHTVIKGGQIVVQDGERCAHWLTGQTICANPPTDPETEDQLRGWFQDHYSLTLDSFKLERQGAE